MKEDAELLHAFVSKRDEASFRELVQRRIGFVYAVTLRRLRDSHLAQDATQAVFIALARKAEKVARGPSVVGWLHRSSCLESLHLMRAQTNRLNRETEAERLGTTTGGPGTSVATGHLDLVLDEILDELPETDRDILIARYFSNETFAVIGGRTGRSENATRMRADRALTRLRDRLAARGFASAATVLAGVLPSYASAAVPGGLAVTVANTALTTLGASAVSASLFLTMTTQKIATAAAVLAVAGFAGYEVYQNRNLNAELSALRQQQAQIADANRSLQQQLASSKRAPASTRAPDFGPQAEAKATARSTAPAKPPVPTGVTRIAPAGWRANGSKPEAFEVGVDQNHAFGGVPSAYVKSVDDSAEKAFGGMMQSTAAEQYKNQRVRLTVWIKTEDANNGGAHLWLRVDSPEKGRLLGFDNMDGRAPKGTNDWEEYSIVLDVPPEAKSLNYGFFISGKGQMWVNGLNIERVGPEVPTTNLLTRANSLPTAPVNLGFNPAPTPSGG